MPVFTIAYRSRNLIEEQTLDSAAEIQRLLEQSRTRNLRLGITGALLFNEGRFVQILEGDEQPVLAVMDSIKRDTRHTDVDVLPSRLAPQRTFAQWSMAFIGNSPAARGYYRDFAFGSRLEWTRTTSDLLAALLLELIMLDGSGAPRPGGAA